MSCRRGTIALLLIAGAVACKGSPDERRTTHEGATSSALAALESHLDRRPKTYGDPRDEFRGNSAAPGVAPPPAPVKPAVPSMAVRISDTGSLPVMAVRRVVRLQRDALKRCYESRLKSAPDLAGTTIVSITIGRDGSVRKVDGLGTNDPPLRDPEVIRCLRKIFETLKFPRPKEEVENAHATFRFSPSGGDEPWSSGRVLGYGSKPSLMTALRVVGCTRVEDAKQPPGEHDPDVLKARLEDVEVTATLFGADKKQPTKEMVERLEAKGAVFQNDSIVLGISVAGDTDRSQARALLDEILER